MPDHLSALGFRFEHAQAFEETVRLAVEHGDAVVSPHGSYVRWRWAPGIELWPQATSDLQLAGCHPFFDDGSSVSMTPASWQVDPEHVMDGSVTGHVVVDQAWRMQVPDFDHQPHTTGEPLRTAVVVFVHALHDLSERDDAPGVPSYTEHPGAHHTYGRFEGRVVEATLQQNTLSKGRFWHLRVEAPTGHIAVVCASNVMRKRPSPGKWLECDGWLTARPLHPEEVA